MLPRAAHSGPQGKSGLRAQVTERVIIVIVNVLAQAILAQAISAHVIIVIDSPHRFGGMPRQWGTQILVGGNMDPGNIGTRRPLTHKKNGMRGERTKTPNSDFKPIRLPFDSVVGRKRFHRTTLQHSRTASRL